MSILEKNLEGIKEQNPILASRLANYQLSSDLKFQLLETDSGDVNLIYDGIELHSGIDPQNEALEIFAQISDKSRYSITILVGLGLGYLFKRIYLSSSSKLVVFEPNIDILKFVLEVADLSTELNDKRVCIASTMQELKSCLEKSYLHKDSISIAHLPSAKSTYKNEITQLCQEMPGMQSNLESNYMSLFEKSQAWLVEGLKNVPYFSQSYNIASLQDEFKNKPAIIVAAGPSLDESLEYLAKYRNNAVIFCAGNAYKSLASYDIKPDFIAFIESLDNANQVKGLDISESNFLIQAVACNSVYKLNPKRKFVFYSNNDLVSRWISDLAGFNIQNYENKGNVSYCCMYSAYMMGCNPIILAGQDFAYTNGLVYSTSSAYGEITCLIDESTGEYQIDVKDKEKFNLHYGCDNHPMSSEHLLNIKIQEIKSKLIPVNGQNGNKILSSMNYSGFIENFQQFAYEKHIENPDLTLINTSIGGAQIDGFANIPIRQVVESLDSPNNSAANIISEKLSNYVEPVKVAQQKIESNISEMSQAIDIYLSVAEMGLNAATNLEIVLADANLDIEKIKLYSNKLFEYYVKFQDEFFSNYRVLTNAVFKELLELTIFMEDEEQLTGLGGLTNMAVASKNFYQKFIVNITQVKAIIDKKPNDSAL